MRFYDQVTFDCFYRVIVLLLPISIGFGDTIFFFGCNGVVSARGFFGLNLGLMVAGFPVLVRVFPVFILASMKVICFFASIRVCGNLIPSSKPCLFYFAIPSSGFGKYRDQRDPGLVCGTFSKKIYGLLGIARCDGYFFIVGVEVVFDILYFSSLSIDQFVPQAPLARTRRGLDYERHMEFLSLFIVDTLILSAIVEVSSASQISSVSGNQSSRFSILSSSSSERSNSNQSLDWMLFRSSTQDFLQGERIREV